MSNELWKKIRGQRETTYIMGETNTFGQILRGQEAAEDEAMHKPGLNYARDLEAIHRDGTQVVDHLVGSSLGNDKLMEVLGRNKAKVALSEAGAELCKYKGIVKYSDGELGKSRVPENKECLVFAAGSIDKKMTSPRRIEKSFKGNGMFILVWKDQKYAVAHERHNDAKPIYDSIIAEALSR